MDPPFGIGKTLEDGQALFPGPGIEAAFVENGLNVREPAMRLLAGRNDDAHPFDCSPEFPRVSIDQFLRGSCFISAVSASRGTPRSISAPSAISPLTPEKQSK